MRKKRVLAFLLAFSMAVGTNTTTVLAAENGAAEVITATAEEETMPEQMTDAEEEIETKEDGEASKEEGTSGEEETPEEETSEEEAVPEENGGTDETPSEDIDEDAADDAVSENTVSLPEEEEPVTESRAVHEVRLMSFTDETGMSVTYDANAAATYQYTVSEDGILTQITDENGESLSGVVELASDQGIREIGSAFTGNEEITYVKLPSGVTSIGEGAFKGCTSLKGIYLPNSAQTIGASAFENCTRLTQLALPKNVETIGDKAFSADTALFMIYMRDADYGSLTSIGERAFYQCTALSKFCSDASFVMPGALEVIGASAFEGCASIESVNLNESVSTMGKAAFKNCGKISSVVLSSRLSAISDEAFKGCNNLTAVTFKKDNPSAGISGNTSIGVSAFEGCTGLGAIELVYSVAQVGNYAFKDCSKLIRAEIANGSVELGDAVFNGCSADLTLVGLQGSQVETYAEQNDLRFVGYQEEAEDAAKQYYKYDVFLPGEKPGGKLIVVDKDEKDPNTLNANKGVVAGTRLYVKFQLDKGYEMVSGSLKCNGKPITQDKDGMYNFAMPKGGALLTAEFGLKDSSEEKILGIDADISVELSNGATMNSKNEVDGAQLKVGQTTRLFLIDSKDGNRAVKASKIRFTSKKPEVASVDANGVVRALKEGKAEITAKVKGYDGAEITRSIVVEVSTADIDELRLKAVEYDASVIEETQSGSYEAVKINQVKVKNGPQTFKIKATAYDTEGDDTAAKLKWSTSDSKIAALGSTSTGTDGTENTVTIQAGASGEATITVTATNTSKDAKKKTVTQKFVVRVIDDTPRLASSSLTLNPKLEDGAALEIIRSYDNDIDTDKVELRNEDMTRNTEFVLTYSESESTDVVKTFRVTSRNAENGKTYSLKVKINEKYDIPLKISVKESIPKAKLSLEKKQKKINLFYANDGTEIKPVISGLGNARIAEYALEPLDSAKDNKLFTENFQIDPQTGVITQKSSSMIYGTETLKNKPVVTGYVVLTYEGYKETEKTKLKITIPTQTVKPSYKLDKTSETFNSTCGEQTIELKLLDKKNKNAQVLLNDGEFTVAVRAESTAHIAECEITEDHTIRLKTPSRIGEGKVILRVENTTWAEGKYFDYTYQIKTTGKDPKISLTSKTVTLNSSYPEQIVNFGFRSDQKDTVYAEDQGEFHPKNGVRNTEEYDKLSVSYEDGVGQVQILDSTVKNGSYTFVLDQVIRLNSRGDGIPSGSVTLTVKVKKAVPTIKAKGTAAFNLVAQDEDNSYVETSVLTLSSKDVPEDYQLDAELTKASVKCTTKSCDGYEQYFEWEFEDQGVEKGSWCGQLGINLKQELAKKNYTFTFTPVYTNEETDNQVAGKPVKITVKIYSAEIRVNLSAKGKLNLLDREITEYTTKNSVVYTPAFKNLKDQVDEVKIFDADGSAPRYDDDESEFFRAEVLSDGKIYVSPKPDAEIDNNKTYSVKLWMKLKVYQFDSENGYGTWSKVMKIKTAQTLPKIKTDKSTVSLYLSNKAYTSSFVVEKNDEKSIGKIESISFGKEDTKAYDSKADESFELDYTCQADGSLKVSLKPKASVAYSCGSTNKVTMYVRFAGQGVNTDGVKITMNVKINK